MSLNRYIAVNDITTPVPADAVFPMEENRKHLAAFKVLLDVCDALNGKKGTAIAALNILEYASSDALEFTKAYSNFKDIVIYKCYEFKRVNSDMPKLVEKVNTVLTKLGVSIPIVDENIGKSQRAIRAAKRALL
jgi:antitoxin component HigA of HigAB toxin-antitoxin module